MQNAIDDLLCYKQTQLTSDGKLTFFLKKHSTKEGTWGYLEIEEGEIDFVFLNGAEQERSCIRLNKENPKLLIPPSAWHKISLKSDTLKASLSFYCKPHRYIEKKYGLKTVHGDLLSFYHHYLTNQSQLNVLDVGCGSGRNLFYFAHGGHAITGIDINASSIEKISHIAENEQLTAIKTAVKDLNKPLNLKKNHYHVIFSTVSLQFLNSDRIPVLLTELQQATINNGYHFLVFPIKAEPFSFPDSFTFLPDKEELYRWYQDSGWSILDYNESVGLLHKLDEFGRPLQGLFGHLLAQKIV